MIFEHRPIARATAFIVLSSCCFGSLTTLTVFITRSGLPLLPAMLWRYLLAFLMLALLVRKSRPFQIEPRRATRLILVGGCGQAVITYFSLLALDYLPVGPLAFLFYTYPAWVAVLAAVTGKEELTLVRLIALCVAMAGITVMVGTPFSEPLNATGVMLALGTALLYALYVPALHKAQRGIPTLVAAFYMIIGVMISFFLAGLLTGGLAVPGTISVWALLLTLSLVGTVIAFLALMSGLRILGPVRTSIMATIEPFFTAVLGVIALGEKFTLTLLSGGVLIAGAVILLQWSGRTRREIEPVMEPG